VAVRLLAPIYVENRVHDFGGVEYYAPAGAPGVICRGRGVAHNVTVIRDNAPTHPNILVDQGDCFKLDWCRTVGGQFGIQLDYSYRTILEDPDCSLADLDGVKVRVGCHDTKVVRGDLHGNGLSVSTGDGLDAYDGCDGLTIDGTTCRDNRGNGITIKTVPSGSGITRDVTITGVTCKDNLLGAGLSIEGAQETGVAGNIEPRPMSSGISVIGGTFAGNHTDGVVCGGQNVSLIGVQARSNVRAGIKVGATGIGISIVAPICLGNSTGVLLANTDAPVGSAGQRSAGIWIVGKRVRVVAPNVDGVDALAWDDAAKDALTTLHRYAIWCSGSSDDVDISIATLKRQLDGGGFVKKDTSGTIRVNGTAI